MTPAQFRKLALALPGAIEAAHMNHPDFRLNGKIFATLGYPDGGHAMVKLTSDQQGAFITQAPAVFHPCAGAWGRGGATSIDLGSVKKPMVVAALDAAFENLSSTPRPRPRKAVGRRK